jgi:hypothetical protein
MSFWDRKRFGENIRFEHNPQRKVQSHKPGLAISSLFVLRDCGKRILIELWCRVNDYRFRLLLAKEIHLEL